MPADPILDLAVLLDLVLDFLQREQPALQRRKLALEHLQTVDAGAALPIQSLPRGSRLLEPRFPGPERLALLHLVLPPGVALRAKLRKLRVEALAGIGNEVYFGFKAGNVGVDAVEFPLRGGECVPRSVVLYPRLLELALDFAQPRGLGLELGRAALDFAGMALRLRLRIVAAQEPQ